MWYEARRFFHIKTNHHEHTGTGAALVRDMIDSYMVNQKNRAKLIDLIETKLNEAVIAAVTKRAEHIANKLVFTAEVKVTELKN